MTGETLRKLRAELGLTQAELASRTGYTAQTISHMEHGRKPITQAFEKAVLMLHQLWKVKKFYDSS